MRPVEIFNVAVYEGKKGWFHGFGSRTLTGKKGNLIEEVVGVIELEDGKIIQLSTNRFKFLDSKKVVVGQAKGENDGEQHSNEVDNDQ